MILKIYSIRDSAVEAFLQPFFSPTDGAALRSVGQAVNDPQHEFFKHSKDYSLWALGNYDDQTGQIVPFTPPIPIMNCIELITKST